MSRYLPQRLALPDGIDNWRSWRFQALIFLLYVVFVLALHSPGLIAPAYYDSDAKLLSRAHLFEQGSLNALQIFPQRPIPVISFYINYLFDDVKPGGYRLLNMFLLAAVCFLVARLFRCLLALSRTDSFDSASDANIVSIGAGLLYLAHPLQTYVTLYIWQRMALLASLFYFGALLVYVAVRSGRTKHRVLGYFLCVTLSIFAMLSKETAVTLPVILILLEITWFRTSWRAALKSATLIAVIAVIVLLPISSLQRPHGNPRYPAGALRTVQAYYDESGISPSQALITQSRMVFRYLPIIVLPTPERAQLLSPQRVSTSLTDPPETLAATVLVVMLGLVGLVLLKLKPLWGFGILFYLINLVPEAILVPQYSYVGYRPLLPMFGLFLIGADATLSILVWLKGTPFPRIGRTLILVLALITLTAMAFVTTRRAVIWSDPIRFWGETVASFPNNDVKSETRVRGQALANLGVYLCHQGRLSEAVACLKRALELPPDTPHEFASLGNAYRRSRNPSEAEMAFRRALEIDPEYRIALKGLGKLLMQQKRFQEAIVIFRRAQQTVPNDGSVNRAIIECQRYSR